jgi:hypothetical protein
VGGKKAAVQNQGIICMFPKTAKKTTPPQQYFKSNHSVSSSKTKLIQQESSYEIAEKTFTTTHLKIRVLYQSCSKTKMIRNESMRLL